jgi:hypothetical protein
MTTERADASEPNPRQGLDAWFASIEEYWASPEGQAMKARREAEETALAAWLATEPDVVVTRHGGCAPEVWEGSIDGHTFYFRERHDHWRIELDLRPTGRQYKAWVDGPLDDDASFEFRDVLEGDVIAEGTTRVGGYGDTPLDRIRFIARTIRSHLGRTSCTVHEGPSLHRLRVLLRSDLYWCPACGQRLDETPEVPSTG